MHLTRVTCNREKQQILSFEKLEWVNILHLLNKSHLIPFIKIAYKTATGLKAKSSWYQPHLNTCTSQNFILCLVSRAPQWRELGPTPAAELSNAC